MDTKPYERIELPNGVRLILVPMSGINSVATAVMVNVGSRYETKDINGISHFLEHMVFKGTKKYPTPDDVHIIEREGGLQNAYTDIDVTSYHNKVLSTDWELALEINKELALLPLLEKKHVDMERNVILEEMKRYEDEPAAKVGEAFHTMMYPTQSLGMRIIGEVPSMTRNNEKTLRSYHSEWYKPDRMVVVLSGNFTPYLSHVKQKVSDWFAPLIGGSAEEAEQVSDHQEKPELNVITKPDAQQAHLTLGFRAYARNSPDRFAWSVFNLIMGVGFTSRLFREIREKRGLCYHIRSGADSWKDVGYWSIYAGVATEKVQETTQGILDELKKALQGGVTEEEVAVAKKRLKTILAFKSEDPEFMGEYYGRQELFGQDLLTLDEYLSTIDQVTKQQINKLTQKYIISKTLNMALVWNKPRDEKLTALLKI